MPKRFAISGVSALIAILAAEVGAAAQTHEPPSSWVWSWEDFEVRLSRPGCSGKCAVYEFSIDGEGQVTYVGRTHVVAEGERTTVLARPELELIARKIFESVFWDTRAQARRYELTFIKDGAMAVRSGDNVILDSPEVFLSVRIGEVEKAVLIRSADPQDEDLWKLAHEIDEIVGTSRWTRGTSVP